jgi:putative membrane protein
MTTSRPTLRIVPILCLLAYAAVWAVMAIHPVYPADWLLENVLAVLGVALFVITYRFFPLSNLSYIPLTLFLILHAIGAHYTYAETPIGDWMAPLFGWQRNNFDRVVHFCFGLLLAYPVRELYFRVIGARGIWGIVLPVDLMISLSAVYELVEWGATVIVAPEAGVAFLGAQGDPWDAQKDMALASLGAAITMTSTAVVNLVINPDFRAECRESLRIKRRQPLGEHKLAEYREKRNGHET